MTVQRRTMEMATAAAIAAFGGAIMAGSLQLSIGWAATGPQSGYFPFRLGVLLCIVSVLLFVQAAMSREREAFASREQFLRSLSIFTPTLILVLLMPWAGCYLSSGLYLLYMARAHGHFSWARALLLALCLVLSLYGLFDFWFKVPLAKGPIEAWLGIY